MMLTKKEREILHSDFHNVGCSGKEYGFEYKDYSELLKQE